VLYFAKPLHKSSDATRRFAIDVIRTSRHQSPVHRHLFGHNAPCMGGVRRQPPGARRPWVDQTLTMRGMPTAVAGALREHQEAILTRQGQAAETHFAPKQKRI
jgi:hypothetical protein